MRNDGVPSRTAYGAALSRAAHQVLDGGAILHDPVITRLIRTRRADLERARGPLRWLTAARSRFAEEALAQAVARGTRQAVVLGAGLDTFAFRNPFPLLRVVEVDHPDTRAWKLSLLAKAKIKIPGTVRLEAVDFERETLAERVELEPDAFVMWLGVVPYLTPEAITGTLAAIPADVVFDYALPLEASPGEERAVREERSARVAGVGEPLRTRFLPEELAGFLGERGFEVVEDVGARELLGRYLGTWTGARLMHARRRRGR